MLNWSLDAFLWYHVHVVAVWYGTSCFWLNVLDQIPLDLDNGSPQGILSPVGGDQNQIDPVQQQNSTNTDINREGKSGRLSIIGVRVGNLFGTSVNLHYLRAMRR